MAKSPFIKELTGHIIALKTPAGQEKLGSPLYNFELYNFQLF